ncbi:hypothetical protein ABPG72_009925 [Tetrahymena utriculariae]
MILGSDFKIKKRSKTLQQDENIDTKIDLIFKRSYEEKLLPDINQVSYFSPKFLKSLQHQNRDYRLHSLSLTRPFKLKKEDFKDPQQRFKEEYEQFISGKKPVDYFVNKIVDVYRFEPEIKFQNIQEKQSLFKDLLITNKRQVVFNSKLDEGFIGHKIQDIITPLKGSNKKLQSLNCLQKIKTQETDVRDDYYDDKNFTITQHKQSWVKLFPFNQQSEQKVESIKEGKQHKEFYFKKSIDFDLISKTKKLKTRTQNLNNEQSTDCCFDPYQPESQINNHKPQLKNLNMYYNLSSSELQTANNNEQQNLKGNNQLKQQQKEHLQCNKNVTIKDLNLRSQQQCLQFNIQNSQTLRDSLKNLYLRKNIKSFPDKERNISGQFKEKTGDKHIQLRQFQKERQSKYPQDLCNNEASLKFMRKDSKYLIENFISVHDSEKVRENPLVEYICKQKEHSKKKSNLLEFV